MTLSTKQFERLESILQAIEPEIKHMNNNAQGFVKDQIDRVQKWGQDIRLSTKQWEWLESLYEKHGGGVREEPEGDPLADVGESENPAPNDHREDPQESRGVMSGSGKGPRKATKAGAGAKPAGKKGAMDDDIPF